MFEKIIFTSDLLKVDDRQRNKFSNPQLINIRWMFSLYSEILTDIFNGISCEILSGDEDITDSIRTNIYSKLSLPLSSESWALLYEGKSYIDVIEGELSKHFQNSLAICFEAPPYLLNFFDKNNLQYIDFSIHPTRFLSDYIFGVRTNNSNWKKRIAQLEVPEKLMYEAARISKGRTTRILPQDRFKEKSAIFFGQISIDSSLINNGSIAGIPQIQRALTDLSEKHDKVYYKAHPHAENLDQIKNIVSSTKGCEWLDINAYDALGCDSFYTVSAISSGILQEAKYFKKQNIIRYIDNISHFEPEYIGEYYLPVDQRILSESTWHYICSDGNLDKGISNLESPMKFMINRKWGR